MITVDDLFNPFQENPASVSNGASALLLSMLIASILVLMVMANWYGSLSEVRGAVRGVLPFVERVQSVYNWRGGAAGAHTGFMSETSDTLLSNAGGKRQGQSVVIGKERLVPGYKSWPSPSSSTPRQWEFSTSPCDAPAKRAAAAGKGRERLSAVWKNSNERLAAGGTPQTGGYTPTNRNAMRGRERMKQEAGLYDILHGM